MTTAEIITIGTEIVLGQIVDTNAPYIAKVLTERGIQVRFRTSVSDDKELLKSILKIARERVNLIVTTGGLGLTANDTTREAVSEFFGIRLIHNKEACVRIQKFMEEQHVNLTDEHNKQTLVPDGALVITNDNGTATGFAFHHNGKEIVCLPGVPREMKSMLNKYLEVHVLRCKTKEGCIVSKDLHTFGIRESVVEDIVKKCIVCYSVNQTLHLSPFQSSQSTTLNSCYHPLSNSSRYPISDSSYLPFSHLSHSPFSKGGPGGINNEKESLGNISASEGHLKAMTLVHDGIVTVNILATARAREDAIRLLDKAEVGIRKELGPAVYGVGDETLEYAIATLLKKCNKTIAIAESCTGGLVADKLTNIPGISEFFMEGVVAYSNKAKIDILGVPEELIAKYGAVSPQVARAMAEGIRKRSSTDIGVGITGIAGPTGGTKEKPAGLVYIGVIVDNNTEVKKCQFRGSRIDIKRFSANTSMNMVRLTLLHKIVMEHR